jgi:hypothetical protein
VNLEQRIAIAVGLSLAELVALELRRRSDRRSCQHRVTRRKQELIVEKLRQGEMERRDEGKIT